jgi:PhzF family phenazine biosynthesis protein
LVVLTIEIEGQTMGTPIAQVDAFTDQAYCGNPAGVCILSEARPEDWMQKVAMEMNASETAFLFPEKDGYRLRWFTPAVEIPLCGHATLASAHVLWEDRHMSPETEARFYTKSGLLTARKRGDEIEMDFPSHPASPCDPPPNLQAALGLKPVETLRNEHKLLAVFDRESDVRNLKPDITAVRRVPVQGIIVTAKSGSAGYDFVSRFFAPNAGVDEDPVTGSAHSCLAPYWCQRLGRQELVGYQASARGGTVRVKMAGDRVLISGKAITTLKGELLV